MSADDVGIPFGAAADRLIADVRDNLKDAVFPGERDAICGAYLLQAAHTLEHLQHCEGLDLHLPASMLFRRLADCWLTTRYVLEGPADAVGRLKLEGDRQRESVGKAIGLPRKGPAPEPPAAKGFPKPWQVADYLDRADGYLDGDGGAPDGSATFVYGWIYRTISDTAVHQGFSTVMQYAVPAKDGFRFRPTPEPLVPAFRCFRLGVGLTSNLAFRVYPSLGFDTRRLGDLLESLQIRVKTGE